MSHADLDLFTDEPGESGSAIAALPAQATTIAAGVLTAVIVFMIQAGGLVSNPLRHAGLIWPVYLLLVVAGVAAVAATGPWRSAPITVLLLFWAVLGAWMPYALRVAPSARLATAEARDLGFCAALTIAALFLGRRGGLQWWRLGWMFGLTLTGCIGLWELLTHNHLYVTPDKPWPFPNDVAAATYTNPNNFGIVLLSMLTAAFAWRAGSRSRVSRTFASLAAVWATVMVLISQSRAAALGLVLIAAIEVGRRLKEHPGVVRSTVSRHRRAVIAIVAAVTVGVVASFTVPALAARNPVALMLYAAVQPTTSTSDLFRVRLAELALEYWRDSHYLGAGAGSFEPIMWNDPDSGITIKANLHNGFLELLMQYGTLVSAVLLVGLIYLAALAWRTRLAASIRPRLAVVRAEMLGHVVTYTALGFTASSSLNLPVWWLMLANACACAAELVDRTRTPRESARP